MKIFLITVLFISSVYINQGQPLIVKCSDGVLQTYDISHNKYFILDNNITGQFVGYNFEGDTLLCYFQSRGRIVSHRFTNDLFINIPKLEKYLYEDYNLCSDSLVTIKFGNYSLINKKGELLDMYENEKLIWQKRHTVKTFGMSACGLGYQKPQLSSDYKTFLFQKEESLGLSRRKSLIIEVDVRTGKETIIAKDMINPSYSPDNKFILFKTHAGLYYYFSKEDKKKYSLTSLNAFWIFK